MGIACEMVGSRYSNSVGLFGSRHSLSIRPSGITGFRLGPRTLAGDRPGGGRRILATFWLGRFRCGLLCFSSRVVQRKQATQEFLPGGGADSVSDSVVLGERFDFIEAVVEGKRLPAVGVARRRAGSILDHSATRSDPTAERRRPRMNSGAIAS